MLNIIIYTLCGLGIGFSLGMLAAAVLVDRRTKKRQKQLAQLVGRRGMGKTAHLGNITPFCYLDQEEVEKKNSVYMRPIQDNLEEAANQLNYASLYLGYALGLAEIGETKNARLLTELVERGVLRAFLYIRNALEDLKDNEKDS